MKSILKKYFKKYMKSKYMEWDSNPRVRTQRSLNPSPWTNSGIHVKLLTGIEPATNGLKAQRSAD